MADADTESSNLSHLRMDWSNEVTLEFLKLYECEPAIWNPKDPLHKNRNEVTDAWLRIENALSIECPVKELKKKKESLMASFRPLFHKVKASSVTGSGVEVYKPSWFAYETMARFLKGIYKPRATVTQDSDNEQNDEDDAENSIIEEHGEVHDDPELCSSIANSESTFKPSSYERASRKRKGNSLQRIENRMEHAYKIMKTVCGRQAQDECLIYTESLAKKLKMFDENTRNILMHEIDNLIFHAKINNVNNLSPSESNNPLATASSGHPFNNYNHPSGHSPSHSQNSPENISMLQPSLDLMCQSPAPSSVIANEDLKTDQSEGTYESSDHLLDGNTPTNTRISDPCTVSPSKRKRNGTGTDISTSTTQLPKKSKLIKHDDECDIIGMVVASKLRKISSDRTKYHAEKLINEVLYTALMGDLTTEYNIQSHRQTAAPTYRTTPI